MTINYPTQFLKYDSAGSWQYYTVDTDGSFVLVDPQPASAPSAADTFVFDSNAPENTNFSLGVGNDTYIIQSSLDEDTTITDSFGSNNILFAADVTITSVTTTTSLLSTFLHITLANGAVITVNSPANFTFSIDGTDSHTTPLSHGDFLTQYGSGYTPDASPNFGNSPSTASIDENSDGSTTAVTLADVSAISASAVTYTIVSAELNDGTDVSGDIAISSSGVITYTGTGLDAETVSEITIVVNGSNSAGDNDHTITVTVTDIADNAPDIPATDAISVSESAAAGDVLKTFATLTPDVEGGSVTYALVEEDDHENFTFDVATGELRVKDALDADGAKTSYTVKIRATEGDVSTTQTITITVTDEHDQGPVFSSGANVTADVTEGAADETLVHTFEAATPDIDGATVTYSLDETGDHADFTFDAATRELKIVGSPAERANPYTVTITATTTSGTGASAITHTSQQTLTITVVDDNADAPVFTSTDTTATVAEGATAAIFTAAATSDVAANGVTYSLTAGGDYAEIDADTGAVTLKSDFDFDTLDGSSFTITIQAEDKANSSLTASHTVTVTVTDVNDEAPVATVNAPTVEEGEETVLTASDIVITDADKTATDDENLTITITNLGAGATLANQGTAIQLNDTFTYADLKAGHITLEITDMANFEGFKFTISDGANTSSEYTYSAIIRETATITDNSQDNTLDYGDSSNDNKAYTIDAGEGADVIVAAGGDDIIDGGRGNDSITLDADGTDANTRGSDIVYYEVGTEAAFSAHDGGDVISGFKLGEDKLVLVNHDSDNVATLDDFLAAADGADDTAFTADDNFHASATFDLVYDEAAGTYTVSVTGVAFYFARFGVDANDHLTNTFFTVLFDEPMTEAEFVTAIGGMENYNVTKGAFSDLSALKALFGESLVYEQVTMSLDNDASSRVDGNVGSDAVDLANITIDDSFTLSVDNAKFEIVNNVLRIKADTSFDFATEGTVTVTITASKEGSVSLEQTYTLTVTDSSGSASFTFGATTSVEDSSYTVTDDNTATVKIGDVEENTTGTIFTVQASDTTAGNVVTYRLKDGVDGNSKFSIDATTGAVSFVNGAADFEDGPSFTAVVEAVSTASDDSETVIERSYEVTLTDVNEAPSGQNGAVTITRDANYSFAQDDFATGFTDPDSGDTFSGIRVTSLPTGGTLSTTDGNLNIGDIVTNISDLTFAIDASASTSAFSTTFTFQVYDGELYSGDYTMTVNVPHVTDADPTFTSGATGNALPENTEVPTSQVVYTAVATDSDASDDDADITYSLKGDGSTDDAELFEINSTTGVVTFADATTPDYETKTSYVFTVVATSDGQTAEQEVTINVTDLADGFAFTSGSEGNSYAENTEIENTTAVYSAATDQAGGTVTYSLVGDGSTDDAELFEIDSATGVVTFRANTTPDYENKASYSFEVQATDGTDTITQTVTVSVTDLDDNAPEIAGDVAGAVTEDASANTATGTLTVTDADGTAANQTTTVTPPTVLTGTYGSIVFDGNDWTYTLDNSNSAVQALDAGDTVTDTFDVTAGSDTQTITITITGANDAPVITGAADVADLGEFNEDRTAQVGTSGHDFVVTDVDGDDLPDLGSRETSGATTYAVATAYALDGTGDGQYDSAANARAGLMETGTGSDDLTAVDFSDARNIIVEGEFGWWRLYIDSSTIEVRYQLYTSTAFHGNTATAEQIARAQSLDSDESAYEVFTVRAFDGTDYSAPIVSSVKVNGVNDAPTVEVTTATGAVDENDAAADVGSIRFTASDLDLTDAAAIAASGFTITSGEDTSNGGLTDAQMQALFEVYLVSGTGADSVFGIRLKADQSLDYDTKSSYVINVAYSDGDLSSAVSGDITINVTEEEETAVTLAFTSGTEGTALPENTEVAATAAVYTAAATSSGTVTYSFVDNGTDDDASLFEIDSATGVVTFAAATNPDYENKASYSFEVQASDSTGTITQTVTVSVTDLDDNAPVVAGDVSGAVTEDASSTIFGTITVTDADGTAANQTTIVTPPTNTTGTYGSILFVDNDWTYTLNNSSSAVQALDAGDTVTDTFDVTVGSVTQTITITITGANDAPVITGASDVAFLGQFDDDNTPQVGADSDDFAVTDVDGDDLPDLGSRETSGATTYAVATGFVTRSAQHSTSSAARNALRETDPENTTAVDFSDGRNIIVEGEFGWWRLYLDSGTIEVRYLLYRTDPYQGASATAEQIARAQSLDTGQSIYEVLTVMAFDGTDYSTPITSSVRLDGANDAPTVEVSTDAGAVNGSDEAATIDSIRFTASDLDLRDADAIAAAGFTIEAGTGETATDAELQELFEVYVVSGSGADSVFGIRLKASQSLDFDAKSSYVLNVVYSDGTDSSAASVDITITVRDPDVLAFTSGEEGTALPENTEVATTTAVYTAEANPSATVVFSLEGDGSTDDAELFTIDSSTGVVTFVTATAPNYEQKASYTFTVNATAGGETVQQTVTIAVTDVQEAPTITVEQPDARIPVPSEDLATPSAARDVDFGDEDTGDAASFTGDGALTLKLYEGSRVTTSGSQNGARDNYFADTSVPAVELTFNTYPGSYGDNPTAFYRAEFGIYVFTNDEAGSISYVYYTYNASSFPAGVDPATAEEIARLNALKNNGNSDREFGWDIIELFVEDAAGNVSERIKFETRVIGANDIPVIDVTEAAGNIHQDADNDVSGIRFTVADPDNDEVLDLDEFTITSSDEAVITTTDLRAILEVYTVSGTNFGDYVFGFKTKDGQDFDTAGEYKFTITYNDGFGTSTASDEFTITVDAPLLTVPSGTAVEGTSGDDAALAGTADAEVIQGGDGNDTITTGGGDDLVIGGYGTDTITLDDNGDETVLYRYNSGSDEATDGGDTINNFEIGSDKLIMVDGDNSISNFAEFVASGDKPNLEFGLTGNNVTTVTFIFDNAGTVDGEAGSADAGNRLTINLAEGTGYYSVTDAADWTSNPNNKHEFLDDIFGANFLTFAEEDDVPTDLAIL